MAIEIAVSLARCVFSSIHSPRLSRSLSTSRQALADNRDISCILGFLIFLGWIVHLPLVFPRETFCNRIMQQKRGITSRDCAFVANILTSAPLETRGSATF